MFRAMSKNDILNAKIYMIHFHWSIFRQNLYLWGFSSHIRIFMPSRSKIGGVYCFCPVCHSVLISETLILLITFEQWVLELWYFTWVFLMVIPFRGYLFFATVTLTLEFDLLFEKFVNIANNFWTVSARALIFHMSIASG